MTVAHFRQHASGTIQGRNGGTFLFEAGDEYEIVNLEDGFVTVKTKLGNVRVSLHDNPIAGIIK